MEPESLSELASLYALAVADNAAGGNEGQAHSRLSESEAKAFQTECAELKAVASALAYAVPLQPVATNLKARLLERIAAESAAAVEDFQPDSVAALIEQTTHLKWRALPLTPGIEVATLHIDKTTRRVDCFIRSGGPVNFPQHRHAGEEEIVVLQGQVEINGQTYGVGDRIHSLAGTVHQPITHTGCTLFLRASLDDEILI